MRPSGCATAGGCGSDAWSDCSPTFCPASTNDHSDLLPHSSDQLPAAFGRCRYLSGRVLALVVTRRRVSEVSHPTAITHLVQIRISTPTSGISSNSCGYRVDVSTGSCLWLLWGQPCVWGGAGPSTHPLPRPRCITHCWEAGKIDSRSSLTC